MTVTDDRPIESMSPIERLFAALPAEVHETAMHEFLSTYTAHERANVLPYRAGWWWSADGVRLVAAPVEDAVRWCRS